MKEEGYPDAFSPSFTEEPEGKADIIFMDTYSEFTTLCVASYIELP